MFHLPAQDSTSTSFGFDWSVVTGAIKKLLKTNDKLSHIQVAIVRYAYDHCKVDMEFMCYLIPEHDALLEACSSCSC